MPYATVDGVRLYYETHGDDGPWVTFLHGGLVHSGSWCHQLPDLAPRLADGRRLLLLDARGYGRSDRPASGYAPAELARDVLAVWEATGVERSFVVGFSVGGMTAIQLALGAPERVLGLVLVSTGARPDAALAAAFRERAAAVEREGIEHEARIHLERAFSDAFKASQPELVAEYGVEIARNEPHALARTLEGVASFDAAERVRELDVPTLLVAGELDPGLGAPYARALHDAVAGSELVVLPGAGHTLQIENPGAFNRVVGDFLALHGSR